MFQCKNKGYTICTQPGRFRDESGQCWALSSSAHGNLAASLDVVVKAREGHLHCSLTISVSHVKYRAPRRKQLLGSRQMKAGGKHPRPTRSRKQCPLKGELDLMLLIYPARFGSFLHPIPAWRGRFPLQACQGIQNHKDLFLQVIKLEMQPLHFPKAGPLSSQPAP